MEFILENLNIPNQAANRLEALKTLTKLLLHEIESLAEISPPKEPQEKEKAINLNDSLQRYEVALICNALFEARGNQRKAAKLLALNTTTLHAKIRRYEIDSLNIVGQFAAPETSDESKGDHGKFRKTHSYKNRNNI